jgi:hypothetical protein
MKALIKEREMLKKEIDKLPAELLKEVKDFIEFLIIKENKIDYISLLIQQKGLEKIWVNEAEDLYEL